MIASLPLGPLKAPPPPFCALFLKQVLDLSLILRGWL